VIDDPDDERTTHEWDPPHDWRVDLGPQKQSWNGEGEEMIVG
jgi:hypothetical protein